MFNLSFVHKFKVCFGLFPKAIADANADFICLQETKQGEITRFKAHTFLPPCYTAFDYFPSEGASAGILIAWKQKDFDVTVISKARNFMTIKASSTASNLMCYLTNVYAPCDMSQRSYFFQKMTQFKPTIDGPWLLLGDFNIYRTPEEKNNSNINWRAMDEFNN